MSGAGGLNAGISAVRALEQYLAWVGGSKAAGRAAVRSGLAEQIAAASVAEVNASEAARLSDPSIMPRRTGALAASMSSYVAIGPKLVTQMAPYGRYQHPGDFWPSPVPEAVRAIFFRKTREILAAQLAASVGVAA